MCGLPGHGPGDLIDLSFEGDTVSVIFDAGMSRPLRLTAEEALALVVALRTLDGDSGPHRPGRRRAGAGEGRGRGRRIAVDAAGTVAVALDQVDRLLPVVGAGGRGAAGAAHCVTTPPRATRRPSGPSTPCGCSTMDGRFYLEAWCRRAEGMRVFRLDRIEDVPTARRAGPAAG